MTMTATPPTETLQGHHFEGFPVGYYDLHPDPGINFEMNRFSTGEPDMLKEMRAVAPKIHDLRDYANEFVRMGAAAVERGERLKGAYYLRGAYFSMAPDDPRRRPTRLQFIDLMREHFGFGNGTHFEVPYEGSAMSTYRLDPPAKSRGTIVIFGGFDSCAEEWFPTQCYFERAGYDVVSFEGPGQGSTLDDGQLFLTHEWHKPVAAVLDYFGLDDVTLWGISLGGCLALRAAAFEPRVHRVVCDDVCPDYFEVTLGLSKPSVRTALASLLKIGADHAVDKLIERARKGSVSTDFGVQQALFVTGSKTPSEYLKKLQHYRTDDISALVEQDVLLCGGAEDFCIPLHQFYDQIPMLTHARSVTARLFTEQEQGHQHCQIGNLGLQHRIIKDWIEVLRERDA